MSENDQYRIPNHAASKETELSSGDEFRLRASALDSPEIARIRQDIYAVTAKADAQRGEMLRTPSEQLGDVGSVLRIVRAEEAGMDLEESDDLAGSVRFIHEAYRDSKKDVA